MEKPYFNLILVYTSHRRHNNYLNIVKHLSSQLSVGLLRFKPKHKWEDSETKYWQMCLDYGAKEVIGDAQCHSLVISRFGKTKQRGYYEDILEDTPKHIAYKRVLINVDCLMVGFLHLEEICIKLGKPIFMVPSLKYFGLLDPGTREFVQENNLEAVETGTPYAQHPIFPDFKTDYLLTYPSHVSVQNKWETYYLLKSIVQVLRKISKEDEIVVKLHNVRDAGNGLSYTMKALEKLPFWLINGLISFVHLFDIKLNDKFIYSFLPGKILQAFIFLHNDYIFKRCHNLKDDYPPFGFEHFARGIEKGLITGISQTISEALLQKKKVCICDDLPLDNKPATYRLIVETLGLVTRKEFSTQGIDKIDESVRSADLIQYLKETIAA